jgi:hypothetical protein
MLSIDTNAKTIKGQQYGYMTGVLYLAPFDLSGYQVCPMADIAKCHEGCLNSAGRGAFGNVQQARLRKTKLFFDDRPAFFEELIPSIRSLIRKASAANLIPLCRLNGTSDIRWESASFEYEDIYYNNIFEMFPDLQFYDYTKIPGRRVPDNYALTFSLGEDNQDDAMRWLEQGGNVAAIYDNEMPDEMLGYPTINGDEHDLRFLDPSPSIVALKRKRTWVPMQFKEAA